MNKTPVSTLTGDRLPYWVAKAQKWKKPTPGTWGYDQKCDFVFYEGLRIHCVRDYQPHINGGQCFELIEEFGIHITELNDPITGERTGWECETFPLEAEEYQLYRTQYGEKDELGVACCRAVIASVFGEFVQEEEG